MRKVVPSSEQTGSETLNVALPSDGQLYQPTLSFLDECGLGVHRLTTRRYTAEISTVPGVRVLFQRAADIPGKVDEGSADLAIVGLDRFMESHSQAGSGFVVIEDLGFAAAELVIAVPEAWVDVTCVADLADLALEFRQTGRELRVATKYQGLVRRFLYRNNINYFTIIPSSGTLEAAPSMGFADIIADIVETGSTLRENRLRPLGDGVVFSSQACLIGNRDTLRDHKQRLGLTRMILERVEGKLRAHDYYALTATMGGADAETVARQVLQGASFIEVRSSAMTPVYSKENSSLLRYALTVVIPQAQIQAMVDYLRGIGAIEFTVVQTAYIFSERCEAYERLWAGLS